MNICVIVVWIVISTTSISSLRCAQSYTIKKYPSGIEQYKLILDSDPITIARDYNESPTIEEKFEIALVAGRYDYLMALPKRSWMQKNLSLFHNNNTVYVEDLVDTTIDHTNASKPLHVAIKAASYHRFYLGNSHKKYRDMITTIHFLTDEKANTNAENINLETPLHIACQLGELEGATILLDKNANPHAQDKEGKTPFEYLRKDTPHEIYNAFKIIFNNAAIKIEKQNKIEVDKIVMTVKIPEAPVIIPDPHAPSIRPSKNRPQKIDNSINQTPLGNPKRNYRTIERLDSTKQSDANTKNRTNRPSSAQVTSNNNVKNNSADTSNTNTGSESYRNIETRYLTPGLASTKNRQKTQSFATPATTNENVIDFKQPTLTQQSKQKPINESIIITSPTENIINSSAFTTPIKVKPAQTIEPTQQKSMYATIRSAFFGSSQSIVPVQTPSPRTEATTISRQSESPTPDTIHQAPIIIKPSFTSGKSSSKIHAL